MSESGYSFRYVEQLEEEKQTLLILVRRYQKALEEISRQYENTSVNRALEIAKEALQED